jgi:hypothetical protein
MEPEGSLTQLKEPAIGPYPEKINLVPTSPSYSFKIHLNSIYPSTSGSCQCPLI